MVRGIVLVGVAAVAAVRSARWLHNWGATDAEQRTPMTGDELIPDPADVTTLAVTVDAPSEQVWPWLVQLGQDRGGLYSYEWLENMLGLQIHNANEIRPEWQHLEVGDEVRLVPAGKLGLPAGYALPVARIDPGRTIVLRQEPPSQPWDAVWSFHLLPVDGSRCRLISRSRSARTSRLSSAGTTLMDPVTAAMTRKMLLGIKTRAERSARENQLLGG